MTKFNIGDILANYSGGLDKPAYEVVDNTNGVYRLKQIPSGNYFTWDYATVERYNALYIPPTPPAKGKVYNLDYPANAKNGETITIKASVVNVGGNSGDFSLRLIAAPQMVLVTRHVGIVSAYKFTAPVNLQVTMPSSGASANLGVQCISMDGVIDDTKKFTIALTPPPDPCAGVTCPNGCYGTSLYSKKCVDGHCVKDALIKSNAPECGYTPPVTCTGGSPHYGNGGALLRHFDANNDGIVTSADALRARNDGMTAPEVQFILDASAAGSINAKCPGCYTPPSRPECEVGTKRDREVCWDGSVIHKGVCVDEMWTSTGEKCPTKPPAPECTEGDKKPGYVCSGGKWVPVGTPPAPECTEGDKKPGYVCSGGKWVPITTPPDVAPKYLTAAEATERFRIGLPCYIKCVLPILDMLPGIPYTQGAWVPPFCAITTES